MILNNRVLHMMISNKGENGKGKKNLQISFTNQAVMRISETNDMYLQFCIPLSHQISCLAISTPLQTVVVECKPSLLSSQNKPVM